MEPKNIRGLHRKHRRRGHHLRGTGAWEGKFNSEGPLGRDLSREVLALKMRSEVYCIQGTDGSEVTREKRNWKWGVGSGRGGFGENHHLLSAHEGIVPLQGVGGNFAICL